MDTVKIADTMLFLSTLSLRRATLYTLARMSGDMISIHALLAESDGIQAQAAIFMAAFLSTLSLRRATYPSAGCHLHAAISIHALLAESDNRFIPRGQLPTTFLSTLSLRRATQNGPRPSAGINNFYPRSPCGERQCTP